MPNLSILDVHKLLRNCEEKYHANLPLWRRMRNKFANMEPGKQLLAVEGISRYKANADKLKLGYDLNTFSEIIDDAALNQQIWKGGDNFTSFQAMRTSARGTTRKSRAKQTQAV